MPQLSISLWRWWGRSSSAPVSARPATAAVVTPVADESEISEEELLASVLAETPNVERRVALRQLCGRNTVCRLISLLQRQTIPTVIRDISTTGVGLLLEKPLPLGAFLALEVARLDAEDRRAIPVRVVRYRRQEKGGWLVGCVMLQPLTPEQVEDML